MVLIVLLALVVGVLAVPVVGVLLALAVGVLAVPVVILIVAGEVEAQVVVVLVALGNLYLLYLYKLKFTSSYNQSVAFLKSTAIPIVCYIH